jgi:hypothetical protein
MTKFYYDVNAKNSAISELKYKPGRLTSSTSTA